MKGEGRALASHFPAHCQTPNQPAHLRAPGKNQAEIVRTPNQSTAVQGQNEGQKNKKEKKMEAKYREQPGNKEGTRKARWDDGMTV